jgi:putative chitinase
MKFDRDKFFDAYRAQFGGLSQAQMDGLEALLSAVEQDEEMNDPRWAAYMLATVKHECADTWHPIVEKGNTAYFDKYNTGTTIGDRLGNTAAGDGFLFRGRGYVQITGRANYLRLGQALRLGNGLVDEADKALDPAIAYQIMSYGMRKGAFTGKKLADYITGTTCDYVNARRIINALDQADRIGGYAGGLEAVLKNSAVP